MEKNESWISGVWNTVEYAEIGMSGVGEYQDDSKYADEANRYMREMIRHEGVTTDDQ